MRSWHISPKSILPSVLPERIFSRNFEYLFIISSASHHHPALRTGCREMPAPCLDGEARPYHLDTLRSIPYSGSTPSIGVGMAACFPTLDRNRTQRLPRATGVRAGAYLNVGASNTVFCASSTISSIDSYTSTLMAPLISSLIGAIPARALTKPEKHPTAARRIMTGSGVSSMNSVRSERRWPQTIMRPSPWAASRLAGLKTPSITAQGTICRLPNRVSQARALPAASWLILWKEFTALFDVLHSTGMTRRSCSRITISARVSPNLLSPQNSPGAGASSASGCRGAEPRSDRSPAARS